MATLLIDCNQLCEDRSKSWVVDMDVFLINGCVLNRSISKLSLAGLANLPNLTKIACIHIMYQK